MNDADFEMAELTEQAAIEDWLMKKGICTHGWMSKLTCKYCGKTFDSFEAACAERREILDEYL